MSVYHPSGLGNMPLILRRELALLRRNLRNPNYLPTPGASWEVEPKQDPEGTHHQHREPRRRGTTLPSRNILNQSASTEHHRQAIEIEEREAGSEDVDRVQASSG